MRKAPGRFWDGVVSHGRIFGRWCDGFQDTAMSIDFNLSVPGFMARLKELDTDFYHVGAVQLGWRGTGDPYRSGLNELSSHQ